MKMLVVVAHPDDETFGTGSVPEGVTLAEVRAGELRDAAAVLGATRVRLLDFGDSGWDGDCNSWSLVGAAFDDVVAVVRDVVADERPDVVVTLDPSGGDGHRDHVRIAQATTVAFDEAAPEGATLYYWCLVRSVMRQWAAHNRGSVYDAVPEDDFGCPDELITTVVDVTDLLPLRLEAIIRHRSQASPYDDLPADLQAAFLATDRLIRARPAWAKSPVESELTVPG